MPISAAEALHSFRILRVSGVACVVSKNPVKAWSQFLAQVLRLIGTDDGIEIVGHI